jgi:hypothetical protein
LRNDVRLSAGAVIGGQVVAEGVLELLALFTV